MFLDKEGKSGRRSFFQVLRQVSSRTGEMSLSMRIKLFLILIILMVTMISGALVILTVTGIFTSGLRQTKNEINKQLDHISKEVEVQYGQLSQYALDLSKSISSSIEKNLTQRGLSTEDLRKHPEVLEEVIGGEYEKCMFALQRAKSSGVFIILDATVNPGIENSRNSRAGLYIKNNEPNILNSFAPNTFMLRGPSSIGRQNSITLHSQWRMEFDIADAPYFTRPIEEAEKGASQLSQLYYWSPPNTLPGTTEEVMLCSVPLIDSGGRVFGVCGFDISAMLFKLSHMPDNSTYKRIFCILAPSYKNMLDTDEGFFSGGYYVKDMARDNQRLEIKQRNDFNYYRQEDKYLYRGLQRAVTIYPKESLFAGEAWVLALMMPEKDIKTYIMRSNIQIASLFMVLLAIGVIVSYFLSKKYIMPITKSIDIIKSSNFDEISKTNILEIDDLMEFLSSKREEDKAERVRMNKTQADTSANRLPGSLFDEFVKNTRTLSPAERSVFDLYVEGHTAKEITEILSLSINTIKTHNKRIYMKLNVTSREELLLYVNMLKEAGRDMK